MKFKITKLYANLLVSKFKETDADYEEIELEPVEKTACQAMYEQDIKERAYKIGFDNGYREGWYDRKNCDSFYHKDEMCRCFCNRGLKRCP